MKDHETSEYPIEMSDFDKIEEDFLRTSEAIITYNLGIDNIISDYTYLYEYQLDIVRGYYNEIFLYYVHDLGDLVKLKLFSSEIFEGDLDLVEPLSESIKLAIIDINRNRGIELTSRKKYYKDLIPSRSLYTEAKK